MNLRHLIIDAAAREKAARIIAYAEANHYVPGPGVPPPGDNPEHTGMYDSYRVAFSITHSDAKVWRQLSVSVPSDKLPNPFAVYTLAELFGFTGWDGKTIDIPDKWAVGMDMDHGAVVVAQEIVAAMVH